MLAKFFKLANLIHLMARIIGSIDNVSDNSEFYHLIFTPTKLYICKVMEREEFNKFMEGVNPIKPARETRRNSIGGPANTGESFFDMIDRLYSKNRERGKDVEEDLETALFERKYGITEVDYTEILKVELKKSVLLPVPKIVISTAAGKRSFRVNGNITGQGWNFAGEAKSPGDFLSEVLGDRFSSR